MLKTLGRIALVAAMAVILTVFSALRARRMCDQTIGAEIAPPPHHSTRFVLSPVLHMEGADSGFKPGWVVTYAPKSGTYGTAFYVSFLGKMEARGTPLAVTAQRRVAQQGIEKFRQSFAQADAAVQVGNTFSSAVAVLGKPMSVDTNGNGTIEAYFSYTPREVGRIEIDWLTNGFTLRVSNNIIVRKGYSYMSSR